jgi:hypothetical protein
MFRWFAKNFGFIAILIVMLANIDGLIWLVARHSNFTFGELVPMFHNVRHSLPLIVAGAYGFSRMVLRHPVYKAPYHRWLATTPWRRGLPLPLGAVHLTVVDYVNLAILAAISGAYLREAWWVPLMPFFAAYLIGFTLALTMTRHYWYAALLWFGLALALRVGPEPLPVVCVLVGLYPVAMYVWRESQLQFPWALNEKPTSTPSLGPVFMRLGPKPPPDPIPMRVVLAVSFLLAFTDYAFSKYIDFGRQKDLLAIAALYVVAAMLIAFVRWATYCATLLPPLSTLARLFTGRIIIPNYDYVLIAPLAVVAAGAVVPTTLLLAGVAPDLAFAVTTFALFVIAMGSGPSRSKWQLTGSHRIAITTGKSRN